MSGRGSMLDAERWLLLMERLSLTCDHDDYLTLTNMLDEPSRAYHNTSHIADCLSQLDACETDCENADEIEFSLWLHDAVYDPRSTDNEAESAALASSILQRGGGSPSLIATVQRLILATKHDAPPKHDDERLITDIDLSILGRDAAVYDRYEAAIRTEYSWVPWDVYRSKRREVLDSFLARERTYSTRWFFDRYESQTRYNLQQAIIALGERRE
jgi:predicted metal-dependent HD superfamily phosphohydrolase